MNRVLTHHAVKGLISLVIAMSAIVGGSVTPALAADSVYSIDRSVSVSPSSFAGATSGGDGYDVGFYGDHVFNVFHHGTSLQVMCVNRTDGQPCLMNNGTPVSRTVSTALELGLSGSIQLTDIVVNYDGTLSIEFRDAAGTSWTDQYGNEILPVGTPFTLSGISEEIDGTYHVGTIDVSSHHRMLMTTSDGVSTWSVANYCTEWLTDGSGNEFDYETGLSFSDMLDGSTCDVSWSGPRYLRYDNLNAQPTAVSFQTSAKPTVYIDQATGYMYVPAALSTVDLNAFSINQASDSYLQPGIVCINLNAYTTSQPLGCEASGSTPTWTPLGAMNEVSSYASPATFAGTPTYGLDNMVMANGKLWVFNPVSHVGQTIGSTQNALLCFDPTTGVACTTVLPDFGLTGSDTSVWSASGANQLSLSQDVYGSPWTYPEPATSTVVIGSHIYITMDAVWTWSVTGNTTYRYTAIACVDVSEASGPVNCDGQFPLEFGGGSDYHASIPPIPYLSSTGAVLGLCFNKDGSGWSCRHSDGSVVNGSEFDASALDSPLAQPSESGRGSGYSPSALVIGTRVFVSQLQGGAQVACFDFATNATCALGTGSYPKVLTGITAPYAIQEDPQIPGCIWVNSDGGSSRATTPTIVNFDSSSGGACSYEGSLATLDFITNRTGCQATGVSQFAITSNGSNHLRSASVTVEGTTTIGTVPFTAGGSTDLTTSSSNPTADFSSLNSAINGTNDLTFHVHLATTSSSNLTTVTVHMEWTATRAGCDQPLPNAPRNLGTTPASGSAVVTWQPPASGPTPTKYTVSIPGHGTCVVNLVTSPHAALSCSFSGLTNGTSYTASVVAETIAGTSSAATIVVTPRAPTYTAVPFKDYVHGWSYSGYDLTSTMKADIRAIAVKILAQHCTRVTLTGYSNFTALPSLSRKRAQTVATYLRAELNRRGGSAVTLTVVIGGSTDKFVKTVLNRAVVVQAR